MTKTRQMDRHDSGFTLVELMVSLTVLSVAIAAAFALAFSLMNGFRDHRRAVNVETKTRIILDLLARGVRAASPGVLSGKFWNPCLVTPDPEKYVNAIEVTNSSTAPDQLSVIHAVGGAFASITLAQDISAGFLVVDDNTGFEAEIFLPAVIIEPDGKAHMVQVRVPANNTTTMSVFPPFLGCPANWGGPALSTYPAGSFVVQAMHVTYSVDPPRLMADPDGAGPLFPEVIAEGIEDLQIAVGVENDTDTGSLSETVLKTDDEWHFNDPADAAPPPVTGGNWRALRITVVGVDSNETREDGVNLRPAVEDRAAATVKDPFRRRVFSTTVQLRTFGGSQ